MVTGDAGIVGEAYWSQVMQALLGRPTGHL